jgi:uncharacterized RDD family membrane protein YckC
LDPEQELQAQARLEADYMAGKVTADEYTERRHALRAGIPLPHDAPPEPSYASWGRRAAALVIDSLILLVVIVVEVVVTNSLFGYRSFFVISFAYSGLMVGRWGQTLGKMALGIRVLRAADQGRVTYPRAAARVASTWVLAVFTLPLLLAYLWPLWDPRNQTLYDKMAGTIVVRARNGN